MTPCASPGRGGGGDRDRPGREPGQCGGRPVRADELTSAVYTPDSDYAYNPTGGAITATRISAGVYTMQWSGLGGVGSGGGHVQVTAYSLGINNRRCKVDSWFGGTATILCFDVAGNPADSYYSVLYLTPDEEDAALAYAWANAPAAASYSPDALYLFNSGDGGATGFNNGPGDYLMTFHDFSYQGLGGGHVQVSAYGSGGETRCSVTGWVADSLGVQCFDAAGTPTNSEYTVLFFRPLALPEPGSSALLLAGSVGLLLLHRRRRRRAAG